MAGLCVVAPNNKCYFLRPFASNSLYVFQAVFRRTFDIFIAFLIFFFLIDNYPLAGLSFCRRSNHYGEFTRKFFRHGCWDRLLVFRPQKRLQTVVCHDLTEDGVVVLRLLSNRSFDNDYNADPYLPAHLPVVIG